MSKNISSDNIKEIAKRWQGKRGNLIMVLHELQNEYGYVPREAALALSEEMDIPLARIYEVISFYHLFNLNPPGRHKISVCMGTACYLKGAPQLIEELKKLLGVEEGQTTNDGLFQLEVVRCLGCCGLAPVVMVDDKVFGKVKPEEVSQVLSEYMESKRGA